MKISWYTILTLLLLLAVGIEALSAIEWAVYPYFPDNGLVFARTDAIIFSILAPFSPTFLILLLYTWPVRLAISLDNRFSRRLKSFLNWLVRPVSRIIARIPMGSEPRFVITNHPRLLLLIAVAMAVFLGLIPYRQDLNPPMTPIGVDAHYYIDSVRLMLQKTPAAAISFVMGDPWAGQRPLLLIPMYLTTASRLISVNQALEALPALLGPLLAISIFIFVREGYQNERVAGVASLFSALSFNTTVGLWAGYYANWLALAEAYLFLAALFVFVRNTSASRFLILTLLSACTLLTHPWTWVIVLAVAIAFVLTVRRETGKNVLARPLVLLIAVNILIDFVKSRIFGGLVVAQDASGPLSISSVSQTLSFWPNIITGLFSAYNGLLGNAILLGLPMITMLLLKFRDRFERLLTLWVALGSLPFLVLPSLIQTRILYDMPLSIMASIALLLLIRPVGNKTLHSNLALLLLLLLSANYALMSVTNLVAAPF